MTFRRFLIVLAAFFSLPLIPLLAQSPPTGQGPFFAPNWYRGYVPSPQEWATIWSNKIGYYPGGLPIEFGGTGAVDPTNARLNLGIPSPDNIATLGNNVFTGRQDLKAISETSCTTTISGGLLTIDLSTGCTIWSVANNANISTFTMTGCAAGRGNTAVIYLTSDGLPRSQNWGAKWPGGNQPVLTVSNGAVDQIAFSSPDGCVTKYGYVGGINFQ